MNKAWFDNFSIDFNAEDLIGRDGLVMIDFDTDIWGSNKQCLNGMD